jgi:intein/homing endonuclease
VVDAVTGDWLPIRDFVTGRRGQTMGVLDWRLGARDVSRHAANGRQPVYSLVTSSGLKLRATASHPLRTWEGWAPLQSLRPGDRIAVARSCPVFGDGPLEEHEATLLGLMISDGQCRTPGSSPRYTTADPRLAEVMSEAARSFGGAISPVGHYGYNLVNRRGRGGVVRANVFYAWLASLGLNVTSGSKFVPAEVFRARRPIVAAFLRSLFSGDGSVCASGRTTGLEYDTISEQLAQDVRHLLLRFGIFARTYERVGRDGYRSYRVITTDRDMIRCFAREIGFVPGSRKAAKLAEILDAVEELPRGKSNFDTLPMAAWADMRDTAHAADTSLLSLGIARTTPRQSLPHSIARRTFPATAGSEFARRVDGDIVWDRVREIRYAGEELVYDLEVPGDDNFLANDIVVHNSTYARCGIILNVTPFEPGWEGHATLEISNTTPLPARIYANEGIGQVLFLRGSTECLVSYKDRKGKYDGQVGNVLPRVR